MSRALDTAVAVGILLLAAYALSDYHKPSALNPHTTQPLAADVRRWKHDGRQPVEEHLGNRHLSAQWPEVEALL